LGCATDQASLARANQDESRPSVTRFPGQLLPTLCGCWRRTSCLVAMGQVLVLLSRSFDTIFISWQLFSPLHLSSPFSRLNFPRSSLFTPEIPLFIHHSLCLSSVSCPLSRLFHTLNTPKKTCSARGRFGRMFTFA
jgi:hypothetical protein